MSLRDSFGDAFITLPLLLLGFIFLFGTLTSNTGLLLLFIGQVVLVPILGFLGNSKGDPFRTENKQGELSFDLITALKTLVASAIFYSVHSTSYSAWGIMATPVVLIIIQYLSLIHI